MKCVNLGVLVERLSVCCSQKNRYVCDELHKNVTPNVDCGAKCGSFLSDDDTMDEYLKQLYQQKDIPFPSGNYGKGGGCGVIYVGGGKYWSMIVTGILMLRDTGCKLPVEVWYRGSCEKVEPSDVDGLGVTLIDSDKMGRELKDNAIPTGNVGKGGWEAKLYAIYHSKFDRVLFLDADAYCVSDPVPLFSLLDKNPFIFWKDVESQRRSIKWDVVLPAGKNLNLNPIQGGQILLDKIKLWKFVHIANWVCQNSVHYFKHMFGDQDTWRVAGALLNPVPLTMIGVAQWKESVAFVCSWNDKPYIVHRCQGKMYLQEDIPLGKALCTNPHYKLPSEARVYDLFAQVVNKRKRTSQYVFTEIYAKRLWGKGSGAGTDLKESQLYIDTVNRLARKWNRITDIGCGDGLVSSYLEIPEYTGYDCVDNIVRQCNNRYGGTHTVNKKIVHRKYICLDILTQSDIIDSGDVLLCKDVLHHLPTADVVRLLDSLILSNKWKWILLTQDDSQIHPNQDCHLGGFRALNPKMYPLNKYKIVSVVKIHHKSAVLLEL